jgi:hypothetical protein
MSETEDVQRRSATPDQGDRRRLRSVGYPDPFLVTRLPLEAVVANGIVRLSDGTGILGFAHQPFPDGTRILVGYQEWLYAERLGQAEPAAEAVPVAEDAGPPEVESIPAVEATADLAATPEVEKIHEAVPVHESAPVEGVEPRKGSGAVPDLDLTADFERDPAALDGGKSEAAARLPARGEPVTGPDLEEANPFPDDLTASVREHAPISRDSERESWTDAFRRRRDPEREP